MDGYSKSLNDRKVSIEKAMRIKAEFDLKAKFTDSTPFETVYDALKDNHVKGLDAMTPLDGDLTSYNMFDNDKYLYLDRLKNILDYLKKRQGR
jgi:hypothetical protein